MMEWVRAENTHFFMFHGTAVLNRNISGHLVVSPMSEHRKQKEV